MNENVVKKWKEKLKSPLKDRGLYAMNSKVANELIEDIERGDIIPEIDPNQTQLKFKY